jgi:glycosyltransferase involved in cell wall biosynthesis
MRIAHVIDSLEVGGAEAVVAALCRLQLRAGHSPEVHCLQAGGLLAGRLAAEGVPVHIHGPGMPWILIWRLWHAFRRSKPDVVHCHNKAATVHAAAVARLAGVRGILTTRHGLAAPPYRFRKDFKFWVMVAMFCDRVVAVCDIAHRNMAAGARAAAHKIVTIRNGAYPAPGIQSLGNSLGDCLGESPGLRKEGFTLITVGRMVAAKNYGTLLESVALARREIADLVLWMVGDGEHASSLKKLARDLGIEGAVRFLGERSDVGDCLSHADVFVLSSVSEGLPISILEAMAAGLPSIVTDIGGMPEVIGLSEAGKVVPPGDAGKLAAAIVEFARARNELPDLGRRARSCYREHFTPERMTENYLALYRSCAGMSPGKV